MLASFCEQLLFAPTIIKALEANKSKEAEIGDLLAEITSINNAFNSIPVVKTALEKDEDMDFATMKFSDVEVKSVTDLVKTLRTKMVN